MIRYISTAGNDSNSGASDALAWATVDRVNTALTSGEIRQGDVVLFRRGDTFYGKINTAAAQFAQAGDYCTFGAYGGHKLPPIISGYKLLNTAGGWLQHAAGVWKLDLTNLASFTGYQNITPSTGGSVPDGTNIGHLLVDGLLYGGRKFGADDATAIAALSQPWDFYCDNTQWLYVKASANPTTLAVNIKAATDGTGFVLGTSIRVTGLRMEGSGGHHFAGIAKHVRMTGCSGGPAGGSYLRSFGDGVTRYGNGVELSIGSDDFDGTFNEFLEDIFDVGFTMQGAKSAGRIGWTNCYWRHNRHQRNSQNIEFWSTGTPEAGSGAVNCAVQKNDFGTTLNRWTTFGWRPGGTAGSRHNMFHSWDLGASAFSIEDNSFFGQPAGGSFHYFEVPATGVVVNNNRVFLPAGAKLSGHAGEAGTPATTYTVEQAAAWSAVTGSEANTQFFILPTDPTSPLSAIGQLSSEVVRSAGRNLDLHRGVSTLAASLRADLAATQDAAQKQKVYQTLASNGGNQYAKIATLTMNGSSDKTVATFLVTEAGDSSVAGGSAIVRVGLFAGVANNIRLAVSVAELAPFNRAGAAQGAGPWFKAESFLSRLAGTDNNFAHTMELHFKLSDSFQGIQFVPLTEFRTAGTVRYWDQQPLTGSVPADYSTGGPTVIRTYRSYSPVVTATDIAYAATITPQATDAEIFNIGTLTGNLTVNAPTALSTTAIYDGQRMTFRLTQDATGGRTITWNAAYAFGTDVTAAMIPTAAGAKCEISFRWNAADAKWRAVSIARGF